jgi:hypothetical protein
MNKENPLLGAPRIRSELLMLGVDVGESTVARYVVSGRDDSMVFLGTQKGTVAKLVEK